MRVFERIGFLARQGLHSEVKRARDTPWVKSVRSACACNCAYLCARWHAAPQQLLA